jgi:hypothetical protein
MADEPTLRDTMPPWACAMEDRIMARLSELGAHVDAVFVATAHAATRTEDKIIKHVNARMDEELNEITARLARLEMARRGNGAPSTEG